MGILLLLFSLPPPSPPLPFSLPPQPLPPPPHPFLFLILFKEGLPCRGRRRRWRKNGVVGEHSLTVFSQLYFWVRWWWEGPRWRLQVKCQVQSGPSMDVVVQEFCIFLKFAHRNQVLLVRRDALLILDFGLEILDGIKGSVSRMIVSPVRVFAQICVSVSLLKEKGNYMESRKTVLKNLPAGQQWRNRHGEQT